MVRLHYYFYVTEILVPLKYGKLGLLDLKKALKCRKLPFLSDFDRKVPYLTLFCQKWTVPYLESPLYGDF